MLPVSFAVLFLIGQIFTLISVSCIGGVAISRSRDLIQAFIIACGVFAGLANITNIVSGIINLRFTIKKKHYNKEILPLIFAILFLLGQIFIFLSLSCLGGYIIAIQKEEIKGSISRVIIACAVFAGLACITNVASGIIILKSTIKNGGVTCLIIFAVLFFIGQIFTLISISCLGVSAIIKIYKIKNYRNNVFDIIITFAVFAYLAVITYVISGVIISIYTIRKKRNSKSGSTQAAGLILKKTLVGSSR